MPPPAFIVLYRWRLREGSEAAFIAAWSRISDLLQKNHGSLGSRLHRGSDGMWYSYAQWPTAESRSRAFSAGPVDSAAAAAMEAAIAERLPEVVLEPVSDFLAGLVAPNDASQATPGAARR